MPGRRFSNRSLQCNNEWQTYRFQTRGREGAGRKVMEEVPLEFLQAALPTPIPSELAEDALVWEAELETEAASFYKGTSFWCRLKRRLKKASQCFRWTSNHHRGLCPSCSGLPRATNASNGHAPTFPGDPHVVPVQTELFLMESLTTTLARSQPESWSPRLPLAMTIRFGNRLGLLHLSYPRTCSCPESGTPLTAGVTTPLISRWESST